jgi:transposase
MEQQILECKGAIPLMNVRPYNNKEQLLFPPSVGDYLEEKDIAHVIDEVVEQMDLNPFYQKVSFVGNPAYHPAMMVKIWFYGYATQTVSSRKIADKLSRDIGFIYLSGMQKPDFRTLSDFRKNHAEEFKTLFVQMVKICHRLGMTQFGEISIDSTVMKANASVSKSYDESELIKERKKLEGRVEAYLQEVQSNDLLEDRKYGENHPGNTLPEEIQDKQRRIEKMKRVIEQLKEAEVRLESSNEKETNLTDPDARLQKNRTRVEPGYRAEVAVDSKEQIILSQEVTTDRNDSHQLIPMVKQLLESKKNACSDEIEKQSSKKIIVSADAGYNSSTSFATLEEEPYRDIIDPYVPNTTSHGKERGAGHDRNSPFHPSQFKYDSSSNSFECPEGKTLRFQGTSWVSGARHHTYGASPSCQQCRHFGVCTSNKKGRHISVLEHQKLMDRMREKLSTSEGRKIYNRRKTIVEPVFGQMRHNLGFRSFLTRTLSKVKGEFSLMCITHNLLKVARYIRSIETTLQQAWFPLANSS